MPALTSYRNKSIDLLCKKAFEKLAQFINSFLTYRQKILGYHELKWLWSFFTTPTQELLNQLMAFLNLYQHAKNQFIPSFHFWDTANFRFPWPHWPHPFLTTPSPPKKLISFNFGEIQPILESWNHTGQTHFWPCTPQKCTITF